MKLSFFKDARLLSIFLYLAIISRKKDTAKDSDSISKMKRSWVSGTWKQKDLVLGYPVDFGGTQLPIGFSVYNITSSLPVSGPLLDCTKENTYTFLADSSYSIKGCTELMLPNAGTSGKWRLEIYDAVLRLTSSGDKTAPYWTNSISEKEWSIGLTVYLTEVNANLPVNLILEKQ